MSGEAGTLVGVLVPGEDRSERTMSDQDMEMQFADPDWQPTQRPPVSPVRAQPFPAPVPVEVDHFPDPHQQTGDPVSPEVSNRDKAGDYAEYSQGYRGAPSRASADKSDPSQATAQTPRKKGRSRGSSLFWIIAAIVLIALIANPV